MHICIQKIYHVYYTTQWNFIILKIFSHMTLASPNEKWMRVADIVRRFCPFLLWRREFCFDVVGNFGLKNMTPNCNALAKSIISYLWVSYYTFVFSWKCKTMLFTNKKHAVTSSDRAHNITWYNQIRRRNRWATKQVSRDIDAYGNLTSSFYLSSFMNVWLPFAYHI